MADHDVNTTSPRDRTGNYEEGIIHPVYKLHLWHCGRTCWVYPLQWLCLQHQKRHIQWKVCINSTNNAVEPTSQQTFILEIYREVVISNFDALNLCSSRFIPSIQCVRMRQCGIDISFRHAKPYLPIVSWPRQLLLDISREVMWVLNRQLQVSALTGQAIPTEEQVYYWNSQYRYDWTLQLIPPSCNAWIMQ